MGYNDIANICLSIEKTSDDILNKIAQIDGKFIIFLKGSIDKINLSQIRPEIDRGDYKIKTNPKLEIKLRKIQDDIYKRIEVLDSCIDEIDFKIKEIKLLNEPEKTFFQKFRERLF